MHVRQVEPAVQGRHRAPGEVADHRVVQQIDVEVQHVERRGKPAHLVEHDQVIGDRILDVAQPQRLRRARHQASPGQ
jgi:hypothetical protein